MKISMDKKYRTRDGREPRIICTDAGGGYPVVGIIDGDIYRWDLGGAFVVGGAEHPLDLIEYHEPDIRTIWVNVYPECAIPYEDEVDAKRLAARNAIAIAKPVTFEVKRA